MDAKMVPKIPQYGEHQRPLMGRLSAKNGVQSKKSKCKYRKEMNEMKMKVDLV